MHTGSDAEDEPSGSKQQAPLLTDSPSNDSDSDEVCYNIKSFICGDFKL